MAQPATCGHGGKVAAVLPSGRYCHHCWRSGPEFLRPCGRCTRIDHLQAQLCRKCRAADALDATFNDDVLRRQPKLAALSHHLRDADPKYVASLTTRPSNVWRTITAVTALSEPVAHQDLDQLGTMRAVSQVRSLLVHLGVLPGRDEYAIAFQALAAHEIAALPHGQDQLAVRQFVRWRQQRTDTTRHLTMTQAANDRNELRVILSLIRAFNGVGATINTAHQATLDSWMVSVRTPLKARRFLIWCATSGTNTGLVPPTYQRNPFNLGGTPSNSNEVALRRALTEDIHPPRMRLAVLLTIAHGVRVHKIAELRRDALQLVDARPRIRLGALDLHLPVVAAPWVEAILAGTRVRNRVGGTPRDDTWIFPGYRHDDHMLPASLATKLRAIGVSPRQAHQAAAASLITQVPPAVIARLLGVSLTTAAAWYALAGGNPEHR